MTDYDSRKQAEERARAEREMAADVEWIKDKQEAFERQLAEEREECEEREEIKRRLAEQYREKEGNMKACEAIETLCNLGERLRKNRLHEDLWYEGIIPRIICVTPGGMKYLNAIMTNMLNSDQSSYWLQSRKGNAVCVSIFLKRKDFNNEEWDAIEGITIGGSDDIAF